jgi:hypothetical protein
MTWPFSSSSVLIKAPGCSEIGIMFSRPGTAFNCTEVIEIYELLIISFKKKNEKLEILICQD